MRMRSGAAGDRTQFAWPASAEDERELLRKDMFDFDGIAVELQGYDACFFCLGVSAAGMTEAKYTRLTYDLTIGWANELARINPAMTFVSYRAPAPEAGRSGHR